MIAVPGVQSPLSLLGPGSIVEGPVKTEDPQDEDVRMLFIGDVMLGRYVETLADQQGWGSRFKEVAPVLEGYDLVIANLEGPVPVVHQKTPDFSTAFSFTEESIEALAEAGVGAVSLANNHTFDYGETNFLNTESVLEESGIDYFGHPREVDGSRTYRLETAEQTISFIGFNDVFGILDEAEAVELVRSEATEVDQVIISIHWGNEYETISSEGQRELARKFIEAGADVIIGHHPHVRQEWEEIEREGEEPASVFYSLGNFLFDQYFSAEVEKGYAVELVMAQSGSVTFNVIDVVSELSVPRMVSGF